MPLSTHATRTPHPHRSALGLAAAAASLIALAGCSPAGGADDGTTEITLSMQNPDVKTADPATWAIVEAFEKAQSRHHGDRERRGRGRAPAEALDRRAERHAPRRLLGLQVDGRGDAGGGQAPRPRTGARRARPHRFVPREHALELLDRRGRLRRALPGPAHRPLGQRADPGRQRPRGAGDVRRPGERRRRR